MNSVRPIMVLLVVLAVVFVIAVLNIPRTPTPEPCSVTVMVTSLDGGTTLEVLALEVRKSGVQQVGGPFEAIGAGAMVIAPACGTEIRVVHGTTATPQEAQR